MFSIQHFAHLILSSSFFFLHFFLFCTQKKSIQIGKEKVNQNRFYNDNYNNNNDSYQKKKRRNRAQRNFHQRVRFIPIPPSDLTCYLNINTFPSFFAAQSVCKSLLLLFLFCFLFSPFLLLSSSYLLFCFAKK